MLEPLVEGYLRQQIFEKEHNEGDHHYENNLSNIIIEYLLLKEYFDKCNSEFIKMSDDKLMIWMDKNGKHTCYGTIKIPSKCRSIHHWVFKIIRTQNFIGIGIDETKYARTDGAFFEPLDTKAYGIWSDGDLSSCQWRGTRRGGANFNNGDAVEMIFDLKKRSISVKVNDNDEKTLIQDVAESDDIEYCMAVSFIDEDACIELLDYFES